MEVHHHAHHEGKKTWRSYFWEFLMLFLAVFCSFLAEYKLEHMIEKERGKQYIQSFVEDLKHDTASLAAMTMQYQTKVDRLEVISACYDSLFSKQSCNSCLTDLFVNSQAFWQLNLSDRTLQQLKNAGGMRLLEKADADSVTEYDNLVRSYKNDETTVFQEIQTTLRTISNGLFSYAELRNLTPQSEVPTKTPIVTTDKMILNKYFNTLAHYRTYCIRNIGKQQQMKERATGLIRFFTEKYHFKAN